MKIMQKFKLFFYLFLLRESYSHKNLKKTSPKVSLLGITFAIISDIAILYYLQLYHKLKPLSRYKVTK